MLSQSPLEDGAAVDRSRLEITTDMVAITRSSVPRWPQVVWTREKRPSFVSGQPLWIPADIGMGHCLAKSATGPMEEMPHPSESHV
jgi:hypothetical protein